MRLTVWPEDAPADGLVLDATAWTGPAALRLDMLQGLAVLASPAGPWRRSATINQGVIATRRFLRWLDAWNDANLPAGTTKPDSLTHLSRGTWAAWVTTCNRGRGSKRLALTIGAIVAASPALPESMRPVVLARKGAVTKGPVEFYSEDQFLELRRQAIQAVRRAHRRITDNYSLLNSSDPERSADDTARAQALTEVLRHIHPQDKEPYRTLGTLKRLSHWNAVRQATDHSYKRQKRQTQRLLFLDNEEVLACAVALATIRGFNLSSILTADVPTAMPDSAGTLMQLDIDKTRRGPNLRYFPEILEDTGRDSDGEILRLVIEVTEPVRHHLRLAGTPTNRLLAYVDGSGRPHKGIDESTLTRKKASWRPEGTTIDFRCIRRTFEVRFKKEPVHNTEQTHQTVYQLADPKVRTAAQQDAQQAIEETYVRAMRELGISYVSDDAASVATDTTLAACTDPLHRPGTGQPCADGFLTCLMCSNAVASPRRLPRLLATHDVLNELRSAYPGDLWESRFGDHFQRLTGLINANTSESERAHARTRVSSADYEAIQRALAWRTPT